MAPKIYSNGLNRSSPDYKLYLNSNSFKFFLNSFFFKLGGC